MRTMELFAQMAFVPSLTSNSFLAPIIRHQSSVTCTEQLSFSTTSTSTSTSTLLRARLDSNSPSHSSSTSPLSQKISSLIYYLQARAQTDTSLLLDTILPSASNSITNVLRPAMLGFIAATFLSSSVLFGGPGALYTHAEVPTSVPDIALFDDAGVIPKGNVSLFSRAASTLEKDTGYKIHFVLVRSLPFGDSPSEYAAQLAQDWQLGENDVLFTASLKLARAGAYIGNNVKDKVLSDDLARSIGEETFAVAAGEERYGAAVLDVTNRLIPVLRGETDPGPPDVKINEVVQTYKSKNETKSDRGKYIKVVGGVLVIAFVAPLIQTYWYVRDD